MTALAARWKPDTTASSVSRRSWATVCSRWAASSGEVADAIPGCRYVEIQGAGHSGGITHRHEVREHVLPFLERFCVTQPSS